LQAVGNRIDALAVAPEITRELVKLAPCSEGPSARLVTPADVQDPPWRETSVPAGIEKLGFAARACEAFWLTCCRVGYGPDPRRPSMLWVDCPAGEGITILRGSLMSASGTSFDAAAAKRPFRGLADGKSAREET
jgi:hypothetical protein